MQNTVRVLHTIDGFAHHLADTRVAFKDREAFYFIEDIILNGNPISNDDWVLAYYGNTLVVSLQWNGEFTDLPAMGTDGRWETDEYSDNGNMITLKVLQESTGEIFKVIDEIRGATKIKLLCCCVFLYFARYIGRAVLGKITLWV